MGWTLILCYTIGGSSNNCDMMLSYPTTSSTECYALMAKTSWNNPPIGDRNNFKEIIQSGVWNSMTMSCVQEQPADIEYQSGHPSATEIDHEE